MKYYHIYMINLIKSIYLFKLSATKFMKKGPTYTYKGNKISVKCLCVFSLEKK